MGGTVAYIAQLDGVREVALHGAADLAWWSDRLAGEGLEPVAAGGAAQVVVTGLDARWLAWPFRDLSVCVVARRADESGLYFARAFNASRFIVFFERRWFKLPYSRRDVHVRLDESASMRAAGVAAEMAARTDGKAQDVRYTGPLYLPGRRWLMVDICGKTTKFDFDAGRDRLETDLEELAGFRPLSWHLRRDATHARSRTFRR